MNCQREYPELKRAIKIIQLPSYYRDITIMYRVTQSTFPDPSTNMFPESYISLTNRSIEKIQKNKFPWCR